MNVSESLKSEIEHEQKYEYIGTRKQGKYSVWYVQGTVYCTCK